MKRWLVVLLFVCSAVRAELPPVTGVAPNPAANIHQPSTSLTTTYEMMKRIEQMQAEVQQLTGKVEEQAFQIEELKKQQKTMFTDFDDRIQSLENKPAADQAATETAPPVPAIPAETPANPSVGGANSSAPAVEPPASKPESVTAPEVTEEKAAAVAAATAPEPVSDVEKKEYQQAYDDLRNGKTAQAITEFNAYIANHPASSYASNAHYWLGEAHRVNIDNVSARKAFDEVVKSYPDSAKVPDALLKLGYIEVEEKNTAKAREIFTRITTEFANSKAAGLAQKKLQTLDGNTP